MRATDVWPVVFGSLLAFAACSDEPMVQNPSGDCAVEQNGGRPGYHASADPWVQDCQLGLQRAYWRVFSPDGMTAYAVPRPDREPRFEPICSDTAHPLHALTMKYPLCDGISSAQDVEVINAMALEDALELTRFLHTQLRFQTTADGLGIDPFPIPSDIIDACALSARSAELQTICDREQNRLDSGAGIAFNYEGPGAAELVQRLNTLYGIQ